MSDLEYRLGLDPGGMTEGLARAQSALRQAKGRMQDDLASISSRLSTIGAAFGGFGALLGGFSAAGFVGALKSATDSLDAFNDASDMTGASVEELSSLVNTLAPFGHGLDTITAAAGRLVKAMTAADEESKGAGEAFAVLGIQTRDASGNLRPAQDVLEDVAKALDQYKDGSNKTALAIAIFGKQGAAMLPMLKDLAQAQRQAATVTTEQAAAAEKLAREINALKNAGVQLSQAIAGSMIPKINELIEQFRVGKEAAGGFWAALARFGLATGSPEDNIARIRREIDELNAAIARDKAVADGSAPAFGRGARQAAASRVEANNAEIDRKLRELQYFRLLLEQSGRSTNLRSPGLYDAEGVKPDAPKGGGKDDGKRGPVSTVVDAEIEAMQELAKLFEHAAVTVGAKQQDLMRRLDQMFFDGLIGPELYQGAMEQLFKVTQTAGKDGVGEMNKKLEEQAQRWRDLLDPTERYRRELAEVRALAAEGKLSPVQLWQAENDLIPKAMGAAPPRPDGDAGSNPWLRSMEQGFNSLLDGIMAKTVTLRSVWEGTLGLLASTTSRVLADIGAKWVETELLKTGATEAGVLARVAAETWGAAQSVAAWAWAAVKNVMNSAWEAMAGAYKAIVGIPYVGPILAPIAAGATFAAVAGIASNIASAEGGYDIPGAINPLVQLHAREMVLPAKHADVIRGLADEGAPAARRRSPDVHLHLSAHDSKDARRFLIDNQAAVAGAVRQAYRRGGFSR